MRSLKLSYRVTFFPLPTQSGEFVVRDCEIITQRDWIWITFLLVEKLMEAISRAIKKRKVLKSICRAVSLLATDRQESLQLYCCLASKLPFKSIYPHYSILHVEICLRCETDWIIRRMIANEMCIIMCDERLSSRTRLSSESQPFLLGNVKSRWQIKFVFFRIIWATIKRHKMMFATKRLLMHSRCATGKERRKNW